MCWVAFDRAIKAVEMHGRPGSVEHWRGLRNRIHADVCRHGWSEVRGSFVQSYGSDELDASLLLIPITGFLPATDPRVRATIEAIQRDLTEEGSADSPTTSACSPKSTTRARAASSATSRRPSRTSRSSTPR
jgi:GH15 family glucan-1,4-alpha-glucosidase